MSGPSYVDAAAAVLREWPGTEDRMQRLARSKGYTDGEPVPATVVDAYYRSWAIAFLRQRLTDMTLSELQLRLEIEERMMLDIDQAEAGLEVEPEVLDEVLHRLDRTRAEMARRSTRG